MDDEVLLQRHRGLRTRDVDELRAAISRRLTRHTLEPLGHDVAFDAQLAEVRIGPIAFVYAEHSGAELAAQFTDPVSYYDVNLSLGGRNCVSHNDGDVLVDRTRAAILSPSTVARMHLSEHYRQLHVRIERHALERHLEGLLDGPVSGPVLFRPAMELSGAAASWAESVVALARDLDRPDGLAGNPLALAPWTDFVMTALLTAQPHNFSDRLEDRATPYRRRGVSRAMDFIEANLDRPLTVTAIAAAAGLSARSLQRDFHECLGTTPMAYVQQSRMTRVHEELEAAELGSRVTVTDTALRWGFTHGPRFAAAYRQRYGVAPSQTLRGASRITLA